MIMIMIMMMMMMMMVMMMMISIMIISIQLKNFVGLKYYKVCQDCQEHVTKKNEHPVPASFLKDSLVCNCLQ